MAWKSLLNEYLWYRKKLSRNVTALVHPSREAEVDFGFNEWFRAQDGTPRGEDWQTWSAAMYLYAAISLEQRRTPFFDEIRAGSSSANT